MIKIKTRCAKTVQILSKLINFDITLGWFD